MDCQQRNPGSLVPAQTYIRKLNAIRDAIRDTGLDKLIAMLKQISGLTEKCTTLEGIEDMPSSP